MKSAVLRLVYIIAWFAGLIALFYAINRRRQLVLTYHNIISDELFDSNMLHFGGSCSIRAFRAQLQILQSRFRMTTRLDEPGTCVVTFDDGYQNNLTNAAQELSSRKISGLFFVPACYFDGIRILWVDKVLMWLSYVPPGRYHILGADREVSVAAESRRALWEDIYKALLDEYSLKERLLGELDAAYSFAALLGSFPPKMYAERFTGMTAEDVAELAAMGHKTACHSYRHDILSRLDAAALKLDFRSCATHADKYNTKLYSYPFGGPNEISPAVIEACGRHDFDAAFMNYDTDNPGKLTISRISLDNLSDRYVIHARLSGFESFIKKMLRRRAL